MALEINKAEGFRPLAHVYHAQAAIEYVAFRYKGGQAGPSSSSAAFSFMAAFKWTVATVT